MEDNPKSKFSNTERVYEVISHYLVHGDKTAEMLGMKESSIRRYVRRGKQLGLDIDKSKVLKEIGSTYSKAELLAIAKGARILPGQSATPVVEFKGERTRIGVMGDIHFGSKYCLYPLVNKAFKEFEKQNCDIVCQVGDLTEGMSNRPGQIYELSHLGYHEQKKVAI